VLETNASAPISIVSIEDLKGVLSTATLTVKISTKLMACLAGGKRLGPVGATKKTRPLAAQTNKKTKREIT
jgi:hypothetical protein